MVIRVTFLKVSVLAQTQLRFGITKSGTAAARASQKRTSLETTILRMNEMLHLVTTLYDVASYGEIEPQQHSGSGAAAIQAHFFKMSLSCGPWEPWQ